MYSDYIFKKHQTLLTAIKHIKLSASAPMWDCLCLLKCKPPRQKQMSACRLWVAHLWLWVGSLADSLRSLREMLLHSLPMQTEAGGRYRIPGFLTLISPSEKADRSPTNSTTHQLLHNSVLEAYLNTMTTLPACSLTKDCQSWFKEDLSRFKRLLLKPRTRWRAFRGGVWGFVTFLFPSCFRPYSIAIYKHTSTTDKARHAIIGHNSDSILKHQRQVEKNRK